MEKLTRRPIFILLCGPLRSMVIPAIKSMPRTPIRGRNPEGWGEGVVVLGLVPSLGRTARSRKVHRPAYHHFHPLMPPSQGHGDSCDLKHAPYSDTGPESRGRGKARPPPTFG